MRRMRLLAGSGVGVRDLVAQQGYPHRPKAIRSKAIRHKATRSRVIPSRAIRNRATPSKVIRNRVSRRATRLTGYPPAARCSAPDQPGQAVARLSVINGDASVRRGDSGDGSRQC